MAKALISLTDLGQEHQSNLQICYSKWSFNLIIPAFLKRDVAVWGVLEAEPESANTGNADVIFSRGLP